MSKELFKVSAEIRSEMTPDHHVLAAGHGSAPETPEEFLAICEDVQWWGPLSQRQGVHPFTRN